MEPTITLELTASEVNGLLQVLGELPTKTGAFLLLSKIKQQGDAQTHEEAPAVENVAAATKRRK